MAFTLIMMSPAGHNVFDVLGHALKASHDAGVAPGALGWGKLSLRYWISCINDIDSRV